MSRNLYFSECIRTNPDQFDTLYDTVLPQSKTDFEKIQPQLECIPNPAFGIFKIIKSTTWSEQRLEFFEIKSKWIFIVHLDFPRLAKVVINF